MKALLTGANGFLGKHLVSKLNSTGCKVYSLGRVKTENTNFFHLGSLEDKEKIKKCLSDIKPDYLFHLAGSVSNDEAESKKVNADFAKNILEAIDKSDLAKTTRVLIVGSASEYGEINLKDMPIKESLKPEPFNTYGNMKLRQTQLSLNWSSEENFVVIVRPFNIIGPEMPTFLAVGSFMDQIHSMKSCGEILVGNINSQRDYIDVDDVCSIFWELLNCDDANGEIINICSGKPRKINEILDFLVINSDKNIKITIDKNLIRAKDMPVHYGDNSKLITLLGNFKFTPWSNTLRKLIGNNLEI